MLINWFTVFAQILNFLILVGLLRWLLYKPILQVMQKRQERLMGLWQDGEQLKTEATQALALYQQQQQQLQEQQSILLTEAHAVANQERQRQLEQLQQEITEKRQVWQGDLDQEQAALLETIGQRIIQQTTTIARQGLKDLANRDLEQQIVLRFCDQLHQLNHSQKEIINQALGQADDPILVRTSFEMSPALRQQLQEILQTTFPISQNIETAIAPDILCGIELQLAGQEIVWSLDSYLQGLEQKLFTIA